MPETRGGPRCSISWPGPPADTPVGSIDLDAKADDVLRKIKLAAATYDMYVAYRVVHTDVHNLIAGVVGDPSPPTTGWFTNTTLAASPNLVPEAQTLVVDPMGFFNWAFEKCPARHYAVFFWGHSFGPAGLFNVGEPVTVTFHLTL